MVREPLLSSSGETLGKGWAQFRGRALLGLLQALGSAASAPHIHQEIKSLPLTVAHACSPSYQGLRPRNRRLRQENRKFKVSPDN